MVMVNDRSDVSISGVGTVSGGKFRYVTVSGTGSVNGDIDCDTFKSSGVSSVAGSLKAEHVRISGTTRIDGRIDAGDMIVNGAGDFDGDVYARSLNVSGAATISGSVNAEDVDLKGGVRIAGDCEAECFSAQGGFSVGGLVSAQTVDIKLYATCSAKEIGGGTVTVREDSSGWRRFVKDLGFLPEKLLKVGAIEADEVYVESTKARAVRGGNVRIGPRCEIELVEYTGEYAADPSAVVTAARKIEG